MRVCVYVYIYIISQGPTCSVFRGETVVSNGFRRGSGAAKGIRETVECIPNHPKLLTRFVRPKHCRPCKALDLGSSVLWVTNTPPDSARTRHETHPKDRLSRVSSWSLVSSRTVFVASAV